MPKRKKKLFVKRSCLNGKIVWMHYCTTRKAARLAYWRACKKEVRRFRDFAQLMKKRHKKLFSVIGIDDSSSASSIASRPGLTPQQRTAARELQRLDRQQPPQRSDFYDHIIEEKRRLSWQSKRWRDTQEKMIRYGQTHTKSEYKSNGRPHGGDRKSEKYKQSKREQSASSKA